MTTGEATRAGGGGPGQALPACRFHLAFPVDDLEAAERFYSGQLGCPIGRRSSHWIDFDLGGNQITAHLSPAAVESTATNVVDSDQVPVRHFGLVLPWEAWEALAERLRSLGAEFVLEPRVRFRGEVGEQGTLFVRDPAGNALEFKSFRDPSRLFAS